MNNLKQLLNDAITKQQKRQIIIDFIKSTHAKAMIQIGLYKGIGEYRKELSSCVHKLIPKEMYFDLSANLQSEQMFTLKTPPTSNKLLFEDFKRFTSNKAERFWNQNDPLAVSVLEVLYSISLMYDDSQAAQRAKDCKTALIVVFKVFGEVLLPVFEQIWCDYIDVLFKVDERLKKEIYNEVVMFPINNPKRESLRTTTDVTDGLSEDECRIYRIFTDSHVPPREVEGYMDELIDILIDDLEKPDVDPYQVAAFFHNTLVEIHPFEDGNGTLARLLVNDILFTLRKDDSKQLPVITSPIYTGSDKDYCIVTNANDIPLFKAYLLYKAKNKETSLQEISSEKRFIDTSDKIALENSLRALHKTKSFIV